MFIYHFEASREFAAPAGEALHAVADGVCAGLTSVLTLMEIAVKPLQAGRSDVADEYELLVRSFPNLSVIEVNAAITRRAAELRAIYRLPAADALQVAACLDRGATAFITNDRDLRRVDDLRVLLLSDFLD